MAPDKKQVDVLIVGSGSAGLAAATWLARYGIRCAILEQRTGPMTMGQADGVQCRTVEMFESFGISEELLKESYHVLEVAFWSTDETTGVLSRKRVTIDTEPGLSHQPHVILNQARLNGLLLGAMKRANDQEVQYGYTVKSVELDEKAAADPEAYCASVVARKDGVEERFQAKYVLACDGAHSVVRKSLGFKMLGDSSDAVWGVVDVFPRTDFPDIRRKCTLHTAAGSLLIIPREGGSLVRFYMEMPPGKPAKDVKLDDLQEQARRIFAPYRMEIAATSWWSAYSIGQRRADFFTKAHRVFLTGDACHTHSPKAGQGMNVSLQDGYNIGWKLGAVLRGQCPPSLLETYVLEREKVATDLIEFDRHFTRIFSSSNKDEVTPEYFSEQFIKAGRYTAGLTARYDESAITSDNQKQQQLLAKNVVVGMRMPSRQVVRFCDARAMQLVRALPADGRWRLLIFAGNITKPAAADRFKKLATYLETQLVPKFTPKGADIDSFIEPIVVLSGNRLEIEQEQIPAYFWPATGTYAMRDLHKVYMDDESYHAGHGRVYESYGIDVERGAIVIVRPDQYVSKVCEIEEFDGVGGFFRGFAYEV